MRKHAANHQVQALLGELHDFDAILQRQEGQARVEAAIDSAVRVIDQRRSRWIGDTDQVGGIDLDIAGFLAVSVDQHVVKPRNDEVHRPAGLDQRYMGDKRVFVG